MGEEEGAKGGRNGLAWAGLGLSIRMRFVSKPRYLFACGLCQNRATGGSDDFLQEDFEVVEMF